MLRPHRKAGTVRQVPDIALAISRDLSQYLRAAVPGAGVPDSEIPDKP